jgi:hypothetical protein
MAEKEKVWQFCRRHYILACVTSPLPGVLGSQIQFGNQLELDSLETNMSRVSGLNCVSGIWSHSHMISL